MSWIKDNLIMLLAIALVALAVYTTIARYGAKARYAELQVTLADTQRNLGQCEDANSTASAAIGVLTAANDSIAKQQAIDADAAQVAADRVEDLAAALTAKTAENSALRRRLAKENPDVAAHLATAVPAPLACQLWPEAGYCSD